ncbi:DUF58 domain-containing protein [Salinilacihabitans rarus]|uniref:DUF58 domain-containing protein n=1 Tax=Salinilacihabitans rarus TaxID=2961596 RepID=UPI0020C8BEDE|nr:DUF58 domain-containing protein [Salinilacihabitans rarus]
MTRRPVPLALGVAAFVLGIVHLAGYASLNFADSTLILVGLTAIVAGSSAALGRRGVRERAETPDPERRGRAPTPGTSLSAAVEQFDPGSAGFSATSRRITDGLRAAAVAVLTRFEGLSDEEAHRRVEEGTWTSDERAAAFLSPDVEASPRPLRYRIAAALDRSTAFRLGVRRTAAAVAAIGYGGFGERRSPERLPRYDPEDGDDVAPRTASVRLDGVDLRRERSTAHWTGIGVVALLAVGVGAAAESAAVVLAGVVGVGYAGFARAGSAPTPRLAVERTVSDDAPEPGEEVDVTVTVTNEGDSFLPDLRFVDGVPAGLSVVEGSARLGTALRPGESATLEYVVTARRGSHEFDPALALVRGLSRSTEREFLVGESTELVAEPVLRPLSAAVPLRTTAATFSGRLTTAEGGGGTEFHSVREYRRNDPLSRIDWNRHARTGELATLQFHEERAARVLVLVDARRDAYLAPEPDAAHAVDRSVDAAGRIAATLLERGDTVGLAGLGPTDRRSGDGWYPCWLAPSSGHDHRVRFRELLATHPQFSTIPPTDGALWLTQLRTVRRRLSAETQVVLLTPLCDRGSVEIARRLDSRGHPVTVVSPDPTAERTTSQQLARVARRIRRFDLQRAGIPVVDWRADETVDEAFARTNAANVTTTGGRR